MTHNRAPNPSDYTDDDNEQMNATGPSDDKSHHSPGKKAADLRRAFVTAEEIQANLNRLEATCLKLKDYVLLMNVRNVARIKIDGATKLDRACVETENYLKMVKRAFGDWELESGE